jgi:hypothetical protein
VLILCAAALLALVPAAAGARHRAPDPFIGVWDNQANVYQCGVGDPALWDTQFARMARSGVGLIRRVFDTRCPPQVDDAFMAAAARHHLRVLPVLVDFTNWITTPGPGYGVHPPVSQAAYVLQVAGLVHRYGPHGTFWRGPNRKLRRYAIGSWQVWNEVNLPAWWSPRPNPRSYMRLLKRTSRAIRRLEPKATIVSAGLPNSSQSKPLSYKAYLKRMLHLGLARYVTAVGVQAYSPRTSGVKKVIATYRHLLDRTHHRRTRLWVTEFGWADTGPPSRFNVGAHGQARRITSTFKLLRRLRKPDKLRGVVYYQWVDTRVSRYDTWGLHTGLLRLDGSRKPAFGAFLRALRRF